MQFCALKSTAISPTRLISCHLLWRVSYDCGIRNLDCDTEINDIEISNSVVIVYIFIYSIYYSIYLMYIFKFLYSYCDKNI